MLAPPPPRPALRRLIHSLLPTDAMLSAFCIDYFPAVAQEFTQGLTRTDKLNLLLEKVAVALVVPRLAECCADVDVPAQLANVLACLPPAEAQASALRAELEQLHLLREQRLLGDDSTADLDARIVQLRRAQRDSPQRKEGDLLGDRYWLQYVIGKGGFAKVWQAFDRKTGRLVALKVLHSDLGEDTRRLERFRRGVAKLRAIHHPHVVAVYSEIEQDADAVFVAMEYLPGGDLHQAIVHHKLARSEALHVVVQICEALAYMHAAGMIHRDVKPQNILLTGAGVAKLADFDLVWAVDTTGATRTGSLGTFVYAAPEAMVDGSDVTCRADVYSVAMTLLFVLHGKALPANIHYGLGPFIDRLEAPAKLKALLKRATHLDPARRTATPQALRSELLQVAATLFAESAAPSEVSSPRGEAITRPRRLPLWAAGGALLALIVLIGAAAWLRSPPVLADAEAGAAKRLLDIDSDLQSQRWADAVVKANRLISDPAISIGLRQKATTRRARADQENRVQLIYDRFLSSGDNYDRALAYYQQIPADSVYHASARENYAQLFQLFVEKHLLAGEDARARGQCAEFYREVKVVLDMDPKQVKALAAQDRPCGDPVASLRGGAPGAVTLRGPHRPLRQEQPGPETPVADLGTPFEGNPADADATLTTATTEYVNGNFSQAISIAMSVQSRNPTRAWRIIGAAACNMKDVKLASEAFLHLDSASKQYLVYTCQRQGITNKGILFRLSEQ